MLIFQEWGACYFNTDNNNCPPGDALPTDTRNNNIETWANQIAAAGKNPYSHFFYSSLCAY